MSFVVPILAAFVWPGLFLGSLAGVAAPVIIHLLVRRRHRLVRWAAMDFLIQAQRRNRRRVRLEQLILLALRCLAVLLLASLLARPFVAPGGWGSWFGGIGQTERIVVLDDSFSMMSMRGGESIFSRARQAAIKLLATFEADHDTFTLVLASTPDEPLVRAERLGGSGLEKCAERIAGLSPSHRALDIHAVMRSVRAHLDERADLLNAAVYMIGDFQRVDWLASPPDGGGASLGATSPLAALDGWMGSNRHLTVHLIDVGRDDPRNVAVVAVAPASKPVVKNLPYELSVQIANYSSTPIRNVIVRVVGLDGLDVSSVVEEIGAGRVVDHHVELVHANAGQSILHVEIDAGEGDELALDDTRSCVVQVEDAVRVLIVNGAPSSDRLLDEVSLLRTALDPPGPIGSGNDVTVINEFELEGAELDTFHVVILANVGSITAVAAEHLDVHVEGGGGLILFLGDRTDPENYNRLLYAEGTGLLPGSLGELVTTADPVTFISQAANHPVMGALSSPGSSLLRDVRSWAFVQISLDGPSSVPPRQDENTTRDFGEMATTPPSVLARYATLDRDAAIVERRYGDGRVILFTSTCDRDWNDWATRPSYVVAMLEFVRYASGGAVGSDTITVGAPVEFRVDATRYLTEAHLQTPDDGPNDGQPVSGLLSESSEELIFTGPMTDRAGIHRLQLRGQQGGLATSTLAVAVTLDPWESDMRRTPELELQRSLAGLQWTGWARVANDGVDGVADGSSRGGAESDRVAHGFSRGGAESDGVAHGFSRGGAESVNDAKRAPRSPEAVHVEYVAGLDELDALKSAAIRELWPAILLGIVAILLIEQSLACWFGRRG